MSDAANWEQNNERYLAAALAWLRLRLRRLADDAPDPAELDAAEAAMGDAAAASPPPALLILARRCGLSDFEQQVLLLCAALELDTRTAALCARAQGDPARPFPTFALAMALFDEPAWEALSPERPLRYWRLIEIHQPGAQPLTASALRADERIVAYLKGLNYLDDRLSALLTPLDAGDDELALPPSQAALVERILRTVEATAHGERAPVVQLLGPDAPSKRLVAGAAAAALGLRTYRLSAELLPAQASGDLELLARLWQRENALLPVALYLDMGRGAEGAAPSIGRLLDRIGGLIFLDAREVTPEIGPPTMLVDVARPTPEEQRAEWLAAAGEGLGAGAALLAGQFDLGIAAIRQAARSANSEEDGAALCGRIWEACLAATRPRMDALARRIAPKAGWDDIVLPEAELRLLRQLADQVRGRARVYDEWGFRRRMNRGLGISALFAGESGTGKTMAAEVLAGELGLSLYKIDLSAVVSKYIGETEKNLARLFDAAEGGGSILFFDEADALFGKRSEVKDSHDRYANIEINYLLQRIEAYRGLAILASNMKSALDAAFMRRLRFVVSFPFPGPAERRAIWRRALPPELPTGGLDFERLARLSLTGGSIHSIALNAAFLAARDGGVLTMPLALAAARDELRKLERPINEGDFRP